ncbi:MAG: MBL fold metallo-hydrolase [Roseibium sp.]|uniref:MBL fold metallo-hydrolase n=1 Tax=Roseibium sp. TaxID=1936156 RepID=UPI00260D5DE4|nr:MBL fold metallo-hydrolase [Roseibium sp.]MCV0427451.1 MBL fold metallo-hydrolase [Roseibium sp.]
MVEILNNSEAVPGENARFEELGRGCYAYSADGCSNTGVIVGDRGVLIVDGQATPAHAEKVLEHVRDITDKPVKQVVLTHFHADNSLGSWAFDPGEVIASDLTRRMIETRGIEDIHVSRERFKALFADLPAIPAVCAPTMTIASSMTIDLGGREVRLMHLGRGHTMGDLVVWVPDSGVIYAGDLVQSTAAPYCGDAHLADWPRALDRISAFRPAALMPGTGRPIIGAPAVVSAIETTRDYVTTLRDSAAACVEQGLGLNDTFNAVKDTLASHFGSKTDFETQLPFNVARAYDEALGLDQPQIWTRERCADLVDALSGVVAVAEPVEAPDLEEEDTPVSTVEVEGAEEVEVVEDEALSEESDLVSDSDFAASLGTPMDDDEIVEEESLDLTSEDIVDEDEPSEGSSTADDEGDEDSKDTEKVLEEVR